MTTTPQLTIRLPWPPRQLSPNARGHWAALHKARSSYRRSAFVCALAAGAKTWARSAGADAFDVRLTFHPPDRRRRDWDNLLAAMKPGIDGISDALCINDARFRLAMDVATETIPGGAVDVEVLPCRA